jgi:putative flippase GtrA
MNHFLKFLVVGTIGFMINTGVLVLGVKKLKMKPSVSGPLGAELAILSNFVLNNFWTFSDKAIDPGQIPMKFIQFNFLSFASVVIQFTFLKVGELIFGLVKFKEPFIDHKFIQELPLVSNLLKIKQLKSFAQKFSAYFIFYIAGVGVGLIVNFIIYSQIIWR